MGKTDNPGEDWEARTLMGCWLERKWYNHFEKLLGRNLPFNPAIAFLGEICPQKDWSMNVYISFIHNKFKLKTPKYSSGRDWTNCGIFIGGKQLSPKRKELPISRMNSLDERTQTEKSTSLLVPVSQEPAKLMMVIRESSGSLWRWDALKRGLGTLSGGDGDILWFFFYCCKGR